MKVYFISGLGADERAFQYLDLSFCEAIFIDWLIPLKNEELRNYAKRLIEQIDTENSVVLVGMSFGGMVAQEISLMIPVSKIVLISSVKNRKEMGFLLNLIAKTKLYKLFPHAIIKLFGKKLGDYFFTIQSANESKLLHQILEDTNDDYLEWAIEKIMSWKPEKVNTPIFHIHGDKDRLFPAKNIENASIIKNTGHFMVVNKANEVSLFLKKHCLG
jgi:pimeloyl-ACP methyl ester carboxylesterase